MCFQVYDGKGVPQFSIYGNYQDQIFARPEDTDQGASDGGEELLWECTTRIEDFQQQYCFSKFSIGLNGTFTSLTVFNGAAEEMGSR